MRCKASILLMAVCAIPVWLSCVVLAQQPISVGTSDYFPAAIGTAWEYDADGTITTVRITKHERVGGHACARLETSIDGDVILVEHVSVDENGVYRVAMNGSVVDPALPILKLPVTPGESWTGNSQTGGSSLQGDFKVSLANVAVPAGQFASVAICNSTINAGGTEVITICGYARGVGLIKAVTQLRGQKYTLELKQFTAASSNTTPANTTPATTTPANTTTNKTADGGELEEVQLDGLVLSLPTNWELLREPSTLRTVRMPQESPDDKWGENIRIKVYPVPPGASFDAIFKAQSEQQERGVKMLGSGKLTDAADDVRWIWTAVEKPNQNGIQISKVDYMLLDGSKLYVLHCTMDLAKKAQHGPLFHNIARTAKLASAAK